MTCSLRLETFACGVCGPIVLQTVFEETRGQTTRVKILSVNIKLKFDAVGVQNISKSTKGSTIWLGGGGDRWFGLGKNVFFKPLEI